MKWDWRKKQTPSDAAALAELTPRERGPAQEIARILDPLSPAVRDKVMAQIEAKIAQGGPDLRGPKDVSRMAREIAGIGHEAVDRERVKLKATFRQMVEKWGIKDLAYASEMECLMMLYTNTRIHNEALDKLAENALVMLAQDDVAWDAPENLTLQAESSILDRNLDLAEPLGSKERKAVVTELIKKRVLRMKDRETTGKWIEDSHEYVLDELKSKHLSNCFEWSKQWKTAGYARMACGHKLAAALMMTTAPDDAEVTAPWEAWSLYVPDGLMPMPFSKEGVLRIRDEIDAFEKGKAEDPGPVVPDLVVDVGLPKNSDDLIQAEIQRIWCKGSEPLHIVVKVHGRCTVMKLSMGKLHAPALVTLIKNYVKGVCLALDADVERVHRKGVWGPKSGKKRTGKEPAAGAQYELGAPVTIDLRQHVRDFLAGSGRKGVSPKVQFLVRGHWRHQVCGPGRVDRKYIHIEPFWKGPEDARVLLRPHIIRDKKETPPST